MQSLTSKMYTIYSLMRALVSAIAQVVSGRSLTTEAQVHTHVSLHGIFCGQSGTRTGFSSTSLMFSCQYHSTRPPYSYTTWGMNNRPVGGCNSETSSHPINLNNSLNNGGPITD
jgi:hypothetical protein